MHSEFRFLSVLKLMKQKFRQMKSSTSTKYSIFRSAQNPKFGFKND